MALRVYDSTIRPIEMGRRLIGVVDAQVADDTRQIPHAYTVVLHPDDRSAFSEVERDIVRELAEAVTQHSERESYRLDEPVVVVIRDDNEVKPGSITVMPSLVSAKQPATGAQTGATSSGPAGSAKGAAQDAGSTTASDEAVVVQPIAATMSTPVAGAITSAIVLEDGTRHVLETERVTIGRQSGCTITIRDTNVSREHVQLRRRPNGWTVRDLGSTNGTKLNGVRVEGEQILANGDVIMLGAIKVTFEIS
ncbi:MAG: FhaA domain-containing protein [Ilumatobacteraceae bacterium]